eukprot:10465311-Alexandrium_andersonii.AAC.1
MSARSRCTRMLYAYACDGRPRFARVPVLDSVEKRGRSPPKRVCWVGMHSFCRAVRQQCARV